jgi:ubiquinone/menaquinone biosynthesis C-methylase UbiE
LFAEAFAYRGLSVAGIDIKDEMIAAAKHFVPSGEFKIGKAELIPFDDKSYDLVFYGLVLHETDDLLHALKEGRRVARNGVAALEWRYAVEDFGPPLEHRLTPERIGETAKLAGFIKIDRIPLKQMILYRMS